MTENGWKQAALRIGEMLSDNGPVGYYDFDTATWASWCDSRIREIRAHPAAGHGWITGSADVDTMNANAYGRIDDAAIEHLPLKESAHVDDAAIVVAIRDAGATEKEWRALTHESGPYCITVPNHFTRDFVERIAKLAALAGTQPNAAPGSGGQEYRVVDTGQGARGMGVTLLKHPAPSAAPSGAMPREPLFLASWRNALVLSVDSTELVRYADELRAFALAANERAERLQREAAANEERSDAWRDVWGALRSAVLDMPTLADTGKECAVKAVEVLVTRAESDERKLEALRVRLDDFRDAVLNQRGALAENGMNGDQVNDVLGEFDDRFAAAKEGTK